MRNIALLRNAQESSAQLLYGSLVEPNSPEELCFRASGRVCLC